MEFAKGNWEEFENLSIELLKLHFKDVDCSNITIKKTRSTKDGGYDGIIIISENNGQNIHKILSESKLRAISQKDLPLSDFSKSLVIAINMAAHQLYIFTNLHFSQETQVRISKFSRMTNIKVILEDIFHIIDDLKELPNDLKANYNYTLLEGLQESYKKQSPKNRVVPTPNVKIEHSEPLIGNKKLLFENVCKNMQQNSGIFIVKGVQGSGKSLFIKNVVSLLYSDYTYLYTYIDMVKFSNINDFFFGLLSVVWQVDIIDIINFSKEDIEEITSYISDEEMSLNAKKVLLDIINSNNNSCFKCKDIMYQCLMEYLYKIYTPILKFKKQILVFQNVEYATKTVIDILLIFLKFFYKENIIIIIEIRNELNNTKKFIERCKKEIPFLNNIDIPDLNDIEKKQYINYKYGENFSKEELKVFENICPNNPLLIDQTVELFSSGILYRNLLDYSLPSIQRLYKNPNYLGKIYSQYTTTMMNPCSIEVKKCAAYISLLDGQLHISDIKKFISEPNEIINELLETHLFIYKDNSIEIYHVSILHALTKMQYIQDKFVQISVYEKLFDIVDNINILPGNKEIKKLRCALELNKEDYIKNNWECICDKLIKNADYNIAKELLKKIYYSIHDKIDISKLFLLQFWIVQCYLAENDYKQGELGEHIQDLDQLIGDENGTISEEQIEDYLFLKAKYYLAIGKYNELVECVDKASNTNPKLFYIKALGIKHLEGIDSCIKSLEEGKELFPDYKYIQYSYYDHLLSRSFKCNFSEAKQCIKNMKPLIDILSLEDLIHFKYNEQCVLFYNHELDSIDKLIDLKNTSFKNNLLVEQGRICNLIGQYYWVKGDKNNTVAYFEEAATLQLYTNHHTYWWIAQTNLALLYYEEKENKKCINLIYEIFANYRSNHWDRIRGFFTDKIHMETVMFDKEIVSFFLLLTMLYQLESSSAEEIFNEVFIPMSDYLDVESIKREYLSSKLYKKLKNSIYHFNNHYMIKC